MAQGPGVPGQAQADTLASQFKDIEMQMAKAASLGGKAFVSELAAIRTHLETQLIPAFRKLSKADIVPSRMLADFQRNFNEVEKVTNKYYQVVGSQEEKRLAKMEQGYRAEVLAIKKLHQEKINLAAILPPEQREQVTMRERVQETSEIWAARRNLATGVVGGAGEAIAGQLSALIAPLASMISLASAVNMAAAIGRAEFTLGGTVGRIGGTPGSVRGGSEAFHQAFGGLAGLGGVGVEEGANLLNKVYMRAPQLLNKSLEPMLDRTLRFGISIEEGANLIATSSTQTGVSVQGMVNNLNMGAKMAQKFGQDTIQAMHYIMDFSKVIRTTGADATTSSRQAQAWTAIMLGAGSQMKLGQEEMSNFASKLEGAIAGMSPSHAAGLLLATTGRMPTSLAEISGKTGGPEFAQSVYSLISRGAGAQGQMFVPEAFAQTMGMGNVDVQTARLIETAMKGGNTTLEELSRQGIQSEASNIRDSLKALNAMTDPMTMMRNLMQNLVEHLVPKMAEDISALVDWATSRHEGDSWREAPTNKYLRGQSLTQQKQLRDQLVERVNVQQGLHIK